MLEAASFPGDNKIVIQLSIARNIMGLTQQRWRKFSLLRKLALVTEGL